MACPTRLIPAQRPYCLIPPLFRQRCTADGAQKTKEKSRPGNHAKEGSSFKVTTVIVIPLLAIIIPAAVTIYIAKTSGGSSSSRPLSSASSSGQPRNPSAAPTGSGSSLSPSASPATPKPEPTASLGKTDTVTAAIPGYASMYTSPNLILDNGDCTGAYHYSFPTVTFKQDRAVLNAVTVSPDTNTFAVELYCSSTSSGADFNPNLEYGGRAAFASGKANFGSCYAAIQNSPISGSIPFPRLRHESQLCIRYGSELALVSLVSVSPTEYRLTMKATVWQVLTGG